MTNPNTPHRLRVIGYIRVSRVNGRQGPSYISPKVQRERIEEWAKAHNAVVADWVQEEDRSGKAGSKRPEFTTALDRVTQREVDGIVVWKFSRFGRSLIESALRIHKIEEVGGVVESATEGTQSKLTRNIMLAIAEDELDRLTETWADARQRAVGRGVWIGAAPLGYVRVEGRLMEDPVTGPVIRESYRRAARDGLHAAMAYLQEMVLDRVWNTDSVRKLLASRVYLGEVRSGDLVKVDAHDALTDPKTHTAAQTDPRPRRPNTHYLLSGIATCAECGSGLHGQLQTVRGKTYRRYRCSNRECQGGSSISAETLESHVREILRDALGDHQFVLSMSPEGVQEAEVEVERAEGELSAFVTVVSATSPAFAEGYEVRVQALTEARDRFSEIAGLAARSTTLPAADQLDDPEEFDRALRLVVASVPVTRGRGDIADRVCIRWATFDRDEVAGVLAT